MKNILFILSILMMPPSSCQKGDEPKEEFSTEALNQSVYTLNGTKSTFQEALTQYQGNKVVLDIWASWCGDCIKGLPKVTKLQEEFPEAHFVFLSVDDKEENWKRAIKKFEIQGEHYFFNTGWDNDFTDFIGLDWIPRYMVLDENGKIIQYYSKTADDQALTEALEMDL